jgi:hypothetical protein
MNVKQAQTIRVAEMQIKKDIQSKKQLYAFLTDDELAYLPKIDSAGAYFFKQIMTGKKEAIHILRILTTFLVHQE